MIHSILLHNRHRIESYPLGPTMIADCVEPRPTDFWAWGIINRSGHLRQADPNIVQANLLPGARATVTYRGLKYRGLLYACERAMREGWFVKARSSGSWQVDVAFFLQLMNTLGVPVILIGTYAAMEILSRELCQIRRSCGQGDLIWDRMANDDVWRLFTESLWR